MLALVVITALSAPPKVDSKLVGTWLAGGTPFVTFNADGTGTMEEDRVKWSADGKTLKVTDTEGETDTASYRVDADALVMTMGGVPLTLTRAGAGVTVKKQGALAKRAERAAAMNDEEAEADAMAAAQAYLQKNGGAPQRQAPPQEPRGQGAGTDQLSQLLLSSAWCSFQYNKVSGSTSTARVQFFPNGTWSNGSRYESYNSGPNGTVSGQTDREGAGQWQVRQGQLLMAEAGEPLQVVPGFSVTQNSNGYPIINADGKEYSSCR